MAQQGKWDCRITQAWSHKRGKTEENVMKIGVLTVEGRTSVSSCWSILQFTGTVATVTDNHRVRKMEWCSFACLVRWGQTKTGFQRGIVAGQQLESIWKDQHALKSTHRRWIGFTNEHILCGCAFVLIFARTFKTKSKNRRTEFFNKSNLEL